MTLGQFIALILAQPAGDTGKRPVSDSKAGFGLRRDDGVRTPHPRVAGEDRWDPSNGRYRVRIPAAAADPELPPVGDRLVESLDPLADDEVRASWAAEAIRRRDEVRSGKVETIPGDVAAAQVRSLLRK